MAYKAYITTLNNVIKHSNADRLQVAECFGNKVIVNLDYKEGDIGVYFPVDGKLGEEFAIENDLIRRKDENGNNVGGYLDPDKRNIRALKLRGEQSDGLFLPLSSLDNFCDILKLKVGDTIDVLNGVVICEKYIPRMNTPKTHNSIGLKSKTPKEKFPYFEQHKDTAQLMYNQKEFKEGDICTISLKMHGTSNRTAYTIKTYTKKRLFFKPKKIKEWAYVSGSRRVVLNFDKDKTKTDGYYGDNEFRKKYHDLISPKLEKGETVYGEIVGWVNQDTTIMGQCQNKKVDKEFVKKYGDTTTFSYGCEQGENDIYVYRMTITNEDGVVTEYPTWYAKLRAEQLGFKFVPIFETFIFTTWEDLLSRVEKYYDGVDPIGKTHIREGVVVRIENKETFKAYKHKNFNFKLLEGIIKDSALKPDLEEMDE